MKFKRKLVMLKPVLRSQVLSIKTRTKLLESFVAPVLLYGLSITVYQKVDDNQLKAVLDTARWMMLGLYNRQKMSVKVVVEKLGLGFPLVKSAQKGDIIGKLVLSFQLPKSWEYKISHTKSWLRQPNVDAKQVFSEKKRHGLDVES